MSSSLEALGVALERLLQLRDVRLAQRLEVLPAAAGRHQLVERLPARISL